MTYPYNSTISLGTVSLNVTDLAKMTTFYTSIIGLQVLSQDTTSRQLTTDGKTVILELRQTPLPGDKAYGLYHTAFLVPDRHSLRLVLNHFLTRGISLEGAADHGHSEAIYLSDPEGNGIEIYHDKAVEHWYIRDNGQIIGVTEPTDTKSILEQLTDIPKHFLLAQDTRIGHVHLSVKNALASSLLYQKVFDLGDKMTIPSASWIASGNYHHHLTFNHWSAPYLKKHQEGAPGLAFLTIHIEMSLLFSATLKKARLHGLAILQEDSSSFTTEDEEGIRVNVILGQD
ncbi:VOC family protein [Streptococcus pyogenes]|uniref:VOC family protein n=1 Tax=Streptococcus pyogenes TaxID=1314 RepID=UPI00050BDAA8|nr:VOC family protein [Streptococcus pyogenes]KGE53862.1 glyoxalase/Bleomycin resistance /Dioxygenase superfamily protein [Streptococcus pyogenes AA472]PWU77460.1 VOC family protein [Streptococcus pyogenes]QCK65055.1 VOC family protein [Streptococcus pyogenes]VGQ50906.1 bleomycin resistance protein [Streptococcus pyogenes]VGW31078.1 bleomycin resistance protein [Streptococcus pyogenes]